MPRSICLTLALLLISLPVFAADPLFVARTADEVAASFSGANEWQVVSGGYGAKGSGEWSYATSKLGAGRDFLVRADVTLTAPADRGDGLEMGAYSVYSSHANLGGYENALCVRYHSPAQHYRVAISSLWKEVILWRPTGGVVQAVEFPFEVGKSYRLEVSCRGNHITVQVDDKRLIDWFDETNPTENGAIALAVKEGESRWSSLTVIEQSSAQEQPPVHRPAFAERRWHGGRWFFDGHEPLFVLRDDNVLDHMKLLRGYRAAMYAFNYVTDWNRFQPSQLQACQVVQQGDRLVLETKAIDPKSPSIVCNSALTVTYDSQSRMYAYDHTCAIDLPADEAPRVSREWDHGDAVFLGSVGSPQTRTPQAARPHYEWSIFETADHLLCKVPHNHNGHYAAAESNNGGLIYPHGGRLIGVGDSVLSSVIQIPEKRPELGKCKVGLCWWAYDVHTLFEPESSGALTAGRYVTKVRYTGLPAHEAQQLLSQAELYKPLDPDVRIPVYTAGVGEIEPFDKEVLLASPHTEYRLWAGELDREIGRTDRSSLRIDGAGEAWTLTGPSYFFTPYGKRNRVTVWVKTREVEGEGPTIGFRRLDNNQAEFHALGITGTKDWTRVSYVTEFPQDSFGVMLYFRNCGRGTIWFDDFQIEPLQEESQPLEQSAAAEPAVMLDYRPTITDTLLDSSGQRHHGKIFGTARIAAEAGQTSLVLDGTTYVWPLNTPQLGIGPGTTLLSELKSQGEGFLISAGFQFHLGTVGLGPLQAIEYRLASGPAVTSKPFLRTGQWQRLAIVFGHDKLSLYRDGELVEVLAVKPIKNNWSLHEQSTWHRRLSFFGMGPGDMSLLREQPAYCWKGEVRSFVLYARELSAEEIAKR